MKIRLTKLILALTLFFSSSNMVAQGFLKVENKKIVNGNNQEIILRGMGLGGWMLQEGYMMKTSDFANTQHEFKEKIADLIGSQGMEDFYDAWLSNHVRKIDIDSLAAWGFNSIRLPMHYNLFTLPIEDEPIVGENTWLQKGFDLTDSLLKWCAKNQMYLILDLHAAPGGQGKDEAISDYDPSKPSLWESEENKHKTVALWKKLAERYADNEWIGGYDLLNETNWDMSGNTLLADLYKEITDSIRKVDNKHIIFIEGNWFANDFTGLTPPWDNNMVYSFHKYWTTNDQSSIQWMLDIREKYNVPIWLGESGENSNTWFKEAISLLEKNNIGWSWWPMKKIEDIAGPCSITKTDEYETLLKYWKGEGTKPSAIYATNALMQLTEDIKLENCTYHPDVIDAMFRQINSNETKPYSANNIPGVIYSNNFDMGANQYAYYDKVVANYHLSSGSYTAWNSGWSYRNDGVDIEKSDDDTYSNGFSIGYIDDDEWMVYTVNIAKTAVYNINVRTASKNSNGLFYFQIDDSDICSPISVNSSGGWYTWQTTLVSNVILNQGTHKLKFVVQKGNFNLGGFEFVEVGKTTDIETKYVSSITAEDGYIINLFVNKPLTSSSTFNVSDFTISINGTEVGVTNVELNSANDRMINITSSYLMKAGNNILISYSGNQISATDATILQTFTDKLVTNTLPQRHSIPGRIQAEDYFVNNGFGEEETTDTGGGLNVGWTNVGDYLDYYVSVDEPGIYDVNYRVAAESTAGQIEMQIVEADNSVTSLHTIDLPVTGGWQTWETVTKRLTMPAGQHSLRLLVKKTEFNLNWFEFDLVTGIGKLDSQKHQFNIFPNPSNGKFSITNDIKKRQNISIQILNAYSQIIYKKKYNLIESNQSFDFSFLKSGIYILNIETNERVYSQKIIITKD